jgi:hypothetical protein
MSLFKTACCCAVLALPCFLPAQESDCRIRPEDLKPLIAPDNPFVSEHRWEEAAHSELARLGDDRLLLITQEGCKRHHALFVLTLQPGALRLPDLEFWAAEAAQLLDQVFWKDPIRDAVGPDFGRLFRQKLEEQGLNQPFNFPLGSRNFICEVHWTPGGAATLRIQMVSFVFRETLQVPASGIPPEEDDGWKGSEP